MFYDIDHFPRCGSFRSVGDIFALGAEQFRRVDRLSVTEIAERYVVIKRPDRTRKWDREETPYMVEPQDALTRRDISAVIFCGPSQSGKTESLVLNWVTYSVIMDPMDMIIYNPTQQAARDFAMRRMDRLNQNSIEMRKRLIKARSGDNKSIKQYTSGMLVNLSWPTVSEMAGKPVGRIAITDYDRISDDIGGEGSAFDLADMRTTTFGSFAMTCAESSPSHPITDLRWTPSTPHQAPPCLGILALYNRGDRRRLYWPCPSCDEYFEGLFEHLVWDINQTNPHDAADTVHMQCPICGHKIAPDQRPYMLHFGRWLKDGQSIDSFTGEIVGEGPRSKIASFWLNGVAAGMQTWGDLVVGYLNATKEYNETGSESALQQFYNNQVGAPYRSKAQELERLPEALQARAEPLPELMVPAGVRVLIGTVDVQRRSFVVQVHGISPGVPYDVTIIDRFTIHKSNRFDEAGDRQWARPGIYQEDWDLLIDEVICRSYPIDDNTGREMMVKLTVCDSGGEEGVTTNAYDFQRKLRRLGLAGRFHLVKGEPRREAPRCDTRYPDQRRPGKLAAARGDVPVLFLNSNAWKDALSNRLDSSIPGKGMIHFPNWLKHWFYKELCVEQRTDKGWQVPRGVRNEAWDLMYYCLGACLSPILRIDNIDWLNPPSWAEDWSKNIMIVAEKPKPQVLTTDQSSAIDFVKLGATLA